MRLLLSILLLLVTNLSMAQARRVSFADIDWRVQFVDAPTMDSLSRALTLPYATDLEKVRSIFRWITEHVAYKVSGPIYVRRPSPVYNEDPDDTSAVLKPLNERVALNVFRKREAVCDGYARLFKTLCDYAGLRSEIIHGFARTNFGQAAKSFLSNHSWNAVYLDSSWHLLDATWAAGGVSWSGNEFIRRYDDFYFMTPPEQFIRDHYPDELKWTLMDNPPAYREYNHTPFKSSQFVKNRIKSFFPSRGVIEAALGDEVKIVLNRTDIDTNREEPDPLYTDTLLARSGKLVNLHPEVDGPKLTYRFPVTSDTVEWINIIYRNELVMRYRLDILRSDSDKQAMRQPPL